MAPRSQEHDGAEHLRAAADRRLGGEVERGGRAAVGDEAGTAAARGSSRGRATARSSAGSATTTVPPSARGRELRHGRDAAALEHGVDHVELDVAERIDGRGARRSRGEVGWMGEAGGICDTK